MKSRTVFRSPFGNEQGGKSESRYKKKEMNSVIAYKQLSLREGLAELLAPEIINMGAFKSIVEKSVMNFRSIFGHDESYERSHEKDTYNRSGHGLSYERSSGGFR